MLRRRPSLRLRATAIFAGVFALVFVAGFVLVAWGSLSTSGERHHGGPTMVLNFAARSVSLEGGTIRLRPGSMLAGVAERNPALWLLAKDAHTIHSFGDVPAHARRVFEAEADHLESANFHVAGQDRPLSDAAITRYGDVVVAAGGVDPATISLLDTAQYIVSEGLLYMLLILGAVGLAGVLVALPLLTGALRPLIADAVAVRADQPGRRIREDTVPRELLPLAQGFNAALDRLSDEIARRSRFVTNAAHELRTPLAIMSLQVESLPANARKGELERVVARMTRLVGQMLDLERLTLAGQPRSSVDLVALASECVGEMAPVAIAAGYELALDAPAHPVTVSGDPHAINRALANLVANAIHHGGGRGEILVVVSAARTIDVIDEGPGVPDAIRATLFDPFCRGRWDQDGAGLGLHLVREVIRSHGGEVELLEAPRGAAFRLRFPEPGKG